MRATACFDIGYIRRYISDICDDEGDTAHCSCYSYSTVVVVASMSTTDVWRGMTY